MRVNAQKIAREWCLTADERTYVAALKKLIIDARSDYSWSVEYQGELYDKAVQEILFDDDEKARLKAAAARPTVRKQEIPPVADAGVQSRLESQPKPGARDSIPASAGEGDGVQSSIESQAVDGPAPSTQSEGEAIHSAPVSQVEAGPSSSPPDRNGGVHIPRENHSMAGASIPTIDRSGEVYSPSGSQSPTGLSAAPRKPTEPNDAYRRALARDRAQTNVIWLETHKTSDGRFWSKVCPYEFAGMKRDGTVAAVIESVFGPFNDKQLLTPLGELLTPAMQQKVVRMLEAQDAA